MEKVAGIILAGGRARRFQKDDRQWIDKATIEIDGLPILIRLINVLGELTDEILIIVNDAERKQSYLKLLKNYQTKPVKICLDKKGNCKGPLLGILTGVGEIEAGFGLLLPCDLPYIKVQTLELLIRDMSKIGITLYIHNYGKIEPLPACISVKNCFEVIKLICKMGKRRIDDIYRSYTELILVCSWRVESFDPPFKSFLNLNEPNDLKKYKMPRFSLDTIANSFPYRTEEKITDKIEKINNILDNFDSNNLNPILNMISELENKKLFYWEASLYEFLGRQDPKYFTDAANCYLKESTIHTKSGMNFLAEHAKLDQQWCMHQKK